MKDLSTIRHLQHAYTVAMAKLAFIGSYPGRVKNQLLGYALSLENIKAHINLDPNSWYEKETCNGKTVQFPDLPKDDQDKVMIVLEGVVGPNSVFPDEDLLEACAMCAKLANEFADKVLELKPKPAEA